MNTLITFRFGLHNDSGAEDFLARTNEDAVIRTAREQLTRPIAERQLFITGLIQRVSKGANLAWGWQHVDSMWELVRTSIELCDATPSQVEQHLAAWAGRRFCPWRSYVKSEEQREVRVVASSAPTAAPTSLTAENFRLQRSDYNPVITALDSILPTATVGDVVDSANRMGFLCSPHPNAVAAFCWQSGDNTTTDWYPQGVTTSADASASGQYEDRTVILTSWYDKGGGNKKGVRVSFVDYANPSALPYRHVLLVEPYTDSSGTPNFKAVPVHAGGICWYGYYLYVADTWGGFRVFDTRHIWRVSTGDKAKIGRQFDGSYHAHDYAYALPQALHFAASTIGGYADLRYSAVSLDRTNSPHSLIVPEYDKNAVGTRVVRYPLDESTLLLKLADDGYVHGSEAYRIDLPSMQGATAVGETFYVSSSRGSDAQGSIYTFTKSSGPTEHPRVLPPGPEDCSYWASRGQLWTLAEYPGDRSVLAVKASSVST